MKSETRLGAGERGLLQAATFTSTSDVGPCCIPGSLSPQKDLPFLSFASKGEPQSPVQSSVDWDPWGVLPTESHRTGYGSRCHLKKRRTGLILGWQNIPEAVTWRMGMRKPPVLKVFQLYNGTDVLQWTPSCTVFLLSGIKPQFPVSHETRKVTNPQPTVYCMLCHGVPKLGGLNAF